MRIVIYLFICFLVVGEAIADIYKWIDEEGNVHYGDCPPVKSEAQKIEPAPVPCEEDVRHAEEKLKKLIEQQKISAEQRREAKERILQEKDAKQKQIVENKNRCIQAQQNLHTLSIKKAVYYINEKAQRVYLDDVKRAAEIDRIKNDIETYCNE